MEKKKTDYKNVKRFMGYYGPYKKVLVLDLICAALSTIAVLALPVIVREITNTATESPDALTAEFIIRCAVLYVILKAVDMSANYFMTVEGHMMGAHIEADLRSDFFGHLQELSFGFYSDTKVGQLMSRLSKDLFDVTEFAHHCPEEFLIAGIKFAVSFVILLGVNVPMTVFMFVMIPVLAFFVLKLQTKLEDAFYRERSQIGEINSQIEDSLLGIRVVQSFANEEIEKKKFREGNNLFLKIKRKSYVYLGKLHIVVRLFDGAMYLSVIIAGAYFLMKGMISTGDYLAYIMYASALLEAVSRLAEFMEVFMSGLTGIDRFYEIMDVVPEVRDLENAEDIKSVSGDILFDNVSFSYRDADKDVLCGISIHVCPGDNVALVGPSGGGKTTLSNLIPRFYDVDSGRILIDGKDIRNITLKSLRQNIGVVQQDVYLFSGSIFENIQYGRPGASRDDVMEAARLAGADEFIGLLPDGYDTYVGERGVKLSGGQKQRIAIARVFLKNPPILILDEATSALDNESEKLIQESLEKLSEGRTVFTIAHRLSTIRNAKTILVLNDQGIVESGNHDELMAKKGEYYRLEKLTEG